MYCLNKAICFGGLSYREVTNNKTNTGKDISNELQKLCFCIMMIINILLIELFSHVIHKKIIIYLLCAVKIKSWKSFIIILFVWSIIGTSGCTNHKYHTIKQVKPKTRNRYYIPKKDKHKKRTKTVRVKS